MIQEIIVDVVLAFGCSLTIFFLSLYLLLNLLSIRNVKKTQRLKNIYNNEITRIINLNNVKILKKASEGNKEAAEVYDFITQKISVRDKALLHIFHEFEKIDKYNKNLDFKNAKYLIKNLDSKIHSFIKSSKRINELINLAVGWKNTTNQIIADMKDVFQQAVGYYNKRVIKIKDDVAFLHLEQNIQSLIIDVELQAATSTKITFFNLLNYINEELRKYCFLVYETEKIEFINNQIITGKIQQLQTLYKKTMAHRSISSIAQIFDTLSTISNKQRKVEIYFYELLYDKCFEEITEILNILDRINNLLIKEELSLKFFVSYKENLDKSFESIVQKNENIYYSISLIKSQINKTEEMNILFNSIQAQLGLFVNEYNIFLKDSNNITISNSEIADRIFYLFNISLTLKQQIDELNQLIQSHTNVYKELSTKISNSRLLLSSLLKSINEDKTTEIIAKRYNSAVNNSYDELKELEKMLLDNKNLSYIKKKYNYLSKIVSQLNNNVMSAKILRRILIETIKYLNRYKYEDIEIESSINLAKLELAKGSYEKGIDTCIDLLHNIKESSKVNKIKMV